MGDLFKVAEVQLKYLQKSGNKLYVKDSLSAYDVLRTHWSEHIGYLEEFNVLFLNSRHRVLGFFNVSKGGVAGTVVDAKVIFTAALKLPAIKYLVLSHNHPSGQLRPSLADIELTKKLVAGAKLLDMEIQDHIIVTPDNYYSFSDEGRL